jgi:hypothetical protein
LAKEIVEVRCGEGLALKQRGNQNDRKGGTNSDSVWQNEMVDVRKNPDDQQADKGCVEKKDNRGPGLQIGRKKEQSG